jgi:hypothetical protein
MMHFWVIKKAYLEELSPGSLRLNLACGTVRV